MQARSASELVLKEQAFLETYFQCLSKFAHDKAKEITEKEKEDTKSHATLLWSSTLHLLNTLAVSERGFYSLVFLGLNLGSRLLGRKDTLRTTYSCLLTELRKIENAHKSAASSSGQNLEQLLGSLCGQLQHFVRARMNSISFYEQMLAMSSNRNASSEDLLKVISSTLEEFQENVDHSILGMFKSTFVLESEIVIHLLKAQISLQNCQFLRSLLNLHSANTKLSTWGLIISSKEVKKLGFVSSAPRVWVPELYEWLTKYKSLLVSKFSLYFYEVLCGQGPASEVKNLMTRASTDFFGRIIAFQKKCDALSVLLVLNTSGLDEPYTGLHYHLPPSSGNLSESAGSPSGSYIVIFSYPTERPEKHWPNVMKQISLKSHELNSLDRIVCISDEKLQSTYMVLRIEPLVTMAVIFNSKKPKPDSYVSSFLQTFGTELRCAKVFAALKPGSK